MKQLLNPQLYERLREFRFQSENASLTFEKRLARENGWSLSFSVRVLEEYRRFLYLCMEAGHPCTPSEEVDQAWHLHMVYTRSYWEDLCERVLEKPLHHGPTEGGSDEAAKFSDWYTRTLITYQEVFGEVPPRDIWPPPAVRFATVPVTIRVDATRNWVIRKPNSLLGFLPWAIAIGLVIAAGGLWLAPETLRNEIVFSGLVLAGASVVAFASAQAPPRRPGASGGGGGGCSGGGCGTFGLGCGSDSHSGCGSGDSGCGGGDGGGSGCGGGCGGGGCGS